MKDREIYDPVLERLYDEYGGLDKETSSICAECQWIYQTWTVEKLNAKVKEYGSTEYRIIAFRESIEGKIAHLLDTEEKEQEFSDADTLAILRELSALQIKFREHIDSPFNTQMRILRLRQATLLLQYAKDKDDLQLQLNTTQDLLSKARRRNYSGGATSCEEEG